MIDNNNRNMLDNLERAYICDIAHISDPSIRVKRLQNLYDRLSAKHVITPTRERLSLLNDRQYNHIVNLIDNGKGKTIKRYARSRLTDAQQAQVYDYVTAHDKSLLRYREVRDEAEELYQKQIADYYNHRRRIRSLGCATYGDSCQLNNEERRLR